MHSIELAELASLLAFRAPAILALKPTLHEPALTRYWVQSRTRLERWHRGLTEYGALESAGRPVAMQGWWMDHESMLEEIIVTDMLTRVFAALGMALDHVLDQREIEPVTHSVYLSHLEARNRVLQLLLFGRGGTVDQSMRLNRLRRAVERWIDRLLAPLVVHDVKVNAYAIDTHRAMAYAKEWQEDADASTRDAAASLGQSAMRATLAERTSSHVSMPESNREVASAVIASLPRDCFDSLGLFKSLLAVRLMGVNPTDRKPNSRQPLFPPSMPNDFRQGTASPTVRWLI
jgi:hypothetical protein